MNSCRATDTKSTLSEARLEVDVLNYQSVLPSLSNWMKPMSGAKSSVPPCPLIPAWPAGCAQMLPPLPATLPGKGHRRGRS
jgi:hypothetical protein